MTVKKKKKIRLAVGWLLNGFMSARLINSGSWFIFLSSAPFHMDIVTPSGKRQKVQLISHYAVQSQTHTSTLTRQKDAAFL